MDPTPNEPLLEYPDPARRRTALEGARALFRLHGRLVRARNRGLFEHAVTSAGLRIIETMQEHPGEHLSSIAVRLDLSRQAIHRVIHDLERQEFVSLKRDPHDRRARIPVLTDLGAIYAEGALAWQERAGEKLIANLRLVDIQFARALLDRLWRRSP